MPHLEKIIILDYSFPILQIKGCHFGDAILIQ